MLEIDTSLIEQLETLLEAPAPSGKQKEQVVQDFLEQHSDFLPVLLHE